MTWNLIGNWAYDAKLPAIGAVWRETLGRSFPALAVVEVVRLVEPATGV